MAEYHLYADGDGETHLSPLALAYRDTISGPVHGLSGIPARTIGMGRFVGRKVDVGMHPAPRRQFLVILGGVLELVTSTGQTQHLVPGDVMLAEDCGSKGHISRDVGDEPLMMLAVAIDPDWQAPPSEQPSTIPSAPTGGPHD